MKEQLLIIKKSARVFPNSQRWHGWSTPLGEVTATKTPLKDGRQSVFRLHGQVNAYDGRIFSLKENELVTTSSRNTKKLKPET